MKRKRTPQEFCAWFWKQVKETESGCWEWQRATNCSGYGSVWYGGKMSLAHRVAFAITNGEIKSPDILACHRCDNRLCVNPSHLFLGSHQDNATDKVNKGRHISANALKSDCKRGHAFTEENTYSIRTKAGLTRQCRICRRERGREHRAAGKHIYPPKKNSPS